MPKVSVCIPTFNSARFLPMAIESVLRQTFDDYELIVCDNASTDGTADLCRRFSGPRFRYVRFEERVNQGGNWNRCLDLARGEYIALLHADDVYHPDFLAERVAILADHCEAALAFGAVDLIDERGCRIGLQALRPDSFIAPAPEFFKTLLFGCVISPASVMVRRACYEAVGGFDESRLWGIDWEMWLRIASRYAVAYSSRIQASYRVHSASGTAVGLTAADNAAQDIEVIRCAFRAIAKRPELAQFAPLWRPVLRSLARRTLWSAAYNCELDNRPAVRKNLCWAMRFDPSLFSRPTVWALALSCCLGSWVYAIFERFRHFPLAERSLRGRFRRAIEHALGQSGWADGGLL